MSKRFTVVGQPLPKIDAWGKVTGDTRFADDMVLPRMAFGKLLRSPHAHARVRAIDTARAKTVPGVYAVITGADLPRVKFGILPVSQDEEALCTEKVRMVGDAVAAVAAVDEETADRACRLIDVDYEPLPALMSIQESLAHPEVRIHEYGDGPNVHKNVALQFGDVEAAFAASDLVREDVFFYEGNTHLPMEQHAAVAHATADGKLTLWSSTQTPHYVHRLLARILDMPAAHIRVIAAPVGGGFGGKLDPFAHEIAACRLSQLIGRPVKIACTREEVFYIHRGRHPVLMWIKTGFTKAGDITGCHLKTWLDGGAYGSYGVASTFYTGVINPVTYKMPVYKFEGARIFTNKPPCGPKRGHGTPQPRFALEVQLDKAAEQLGLDPADMRRRILVEPFTKTANHLTVTTIGLGECIDKVVEASGWRDKVSRYRAAAEVDAPKPLWQPRRRRGVGIACSSYMTGAGTAIYALRRHRHRAGLRLDPRVPRGRGARPRSEGRARSSGRHEPHARRPRLLFLARDADVRPGGHPGRRAPALRDLQGRGRQARRGRRRAGDARAKGRRPRRLGEGGGLRAGRGARRGHARRARVRRLVRAPQARGEIQGRWSRSVALLFVHGMCRRAVGR